MDPNQQRRGRGRPRGYSGAPQFAPPNSTNAPRLQLSGPSSVGPRQPSVRPHMPRSTPTVGELTREVEQLNTGLPAQYGRGAIRGRQPISDQLNFRLPRPESSQGDNGKQGTMGQPLTLTANYFPITTYTNWSLYQYRVDFNPPQDRKNTQRGLLGVHQNILGAYIFDGTMLFSSRKYQNDVLELTSKRTFDDSIVKITVKFIEVLEKNDLKFIQVFNILLRSCLRHLNLQLVGRNYYDQEARIVIPQHRIELWPGYETTIDIFENGILMRAEISTKIMRQDTALDFFRDCFSNRGDRETCMNTFKMGIIGQTVLTTYNNNTYRVDDVITDQGINSSFKKKDGTSMTYRDYYREKWNLEIRGGNQPLLVSKKKKSFNKDEEELIYLIPEFCNMTGYTDNMRSNYRLMADVAVHTRVMPTQRIQRLYGFTGRLLENPDCKRTLQNWNLTLENNLVEIRSRVLPCETLSANVQTYESGRTADWTNHIRNKKMYTCAVVNCWVVLAPQRNIAEVNAFLRNIKKASDGMSFQLPQPIIVPLSDNRPLTYVGQLERIISDNNPSLIMIVTESNRSDLYAVIKRKLCVDRAVPSQVVTLKNVQKNNLSVCTKIAIQINSKIGGAPWRVNIPAKGMMIVGFDVCHDKKRDRQSYGGFVSTMDDSHTNYFSCVQPHPKGQDISGFFGNCMIQALHKYKIKNKVFPTSIVIYRDGVGEGQLSYVHSIEVSEVKKCCKNILGDNFSMAFIVVTKRISTRLFVQTNGNAVNPPPGTVVDSVITDPSLYDFFLVSQHVTQGTVTPTHYTVIEDDLKNWSVDRMQKLTYKLTHMYYNWSGTVRVPAPCQLAHKLAYLTATTLQSIPNEGLDELLYFL